MPPDACNINDLYTLQPDLVTQVTVVGFLLLMLVTLLHSYRQGFRSFLTLVTGFLFGYSIETIGIASGSYDYHFAFVCLPGELPLYVACGWAMVFFAGYYTARKLTDDWRHIAVITGLLAVSIDLLMDPGATALQQWIWNGPDRPWFNVPWSNFFGWSMVVACLAGADVVVERRFAHWSETKLHVLEIKLMTALVAYIAFAIMFAVYSAIGLLISLLHSAAIPLVQTLFHAALYLGVALPIFRAFPNYRCGSKLEPLLLAIPAYLLLTSLVYLVYVIGWIMQYPPGLHTLVFVFPFFATATLTGFYWPYREGDRESRAN